jgi:hypothetical protein
LRLRRADDDTGDGNVFAQAAAIFYPAEAFDQKKIAIYRSRIFQVPAATQSQALDLLANTSFVLLSPGQLRTLFPGSTFDTTQMLANQAAAADAYSEKRENEAANPAFASSREWMSREAQAHRAYARYTRQLNGPLKPYLIAAQVYFDKTGGFNVILETNHVSVSHGSVGHSTPPIRTVPIVVFLERDVDSVSISAHVAE